MKEACGVNVAEVRAGGGLVGGPPVIRTASGRVSLEMVRVLISLPKRPGAPPVKGEKVLEVNAEHHVFAKLKALYADDQDRLKQYAQILYDQAMLIEGMPIEDPVAYAQNVIGLLSE